MNEVGNGAYFQLVLPLPVATHFKVLLTLLYLLLDLDELVLLEVDHHDREEDVHLA